ncbi:MAG: hypothetical protein KC421_11180, partial [Anaerolineales bacterium]|nr:hypothetical protein [Anaerolineales bacterium]
MRLFESDEYKTSPDTKRALGDRLALGSGAYFYGRFIQIIIHSRRQVARGNYDRAAFIQSGLDTMRAIEACN